MTFFVLAIVVLLLVVFGVVLYNRLIRLRNKVEEAWAQIDVQLQRRHDLIPNLVNTVKGYAAHEKSTLEDVTAARAAAVSAQGPAAAGTSEVALTAALGRLFALAENYPDLKADQNFRQLQEELSDTEDKVAFARQYYNDNVREWNTRIASVPDYLVAALMRAQKASLKATGAVRSSLRSTKVTSAELRDGRLPEPEKMTSSMPEARMALYELSPITQRMASTRLDLPQPFGPTTPVRPGSITNSAKSTKDLKP